MKQILFSILSLLCMSMSCYALPTSSVLLQHKGNVVVYPLDSLNVALRDAVDGDTLFLSKGIYPSFTIDKKITVRGAGQETIVAGTITVAIQDSVMLTATVLEGISMNDYNGDIAVTKPVNGFKIKQCTFFNLILDAVMEDVFIDRCVCNSKITLASIDNNGWGNTNTWTTKVKSMTITQSKIRAFNFEAYTPNDITLTNCLIKGFNNNSCSLFRGTLINSIIGYEGTGSNQTYSSCSFINSLICTYRRTIDSSCYMENCWTTDDINLVKNPAGTSFWCMYSSDELLENGYIGNDGTIVGCYGGTHSLTLDLSIPKVLSSEVKLDNENRKLNVNLILTAE